MATIALKTRKDLIAAARALFPEPWEKMKPYEVEYMKGDVRKAEALADVLNEKFLASLTPEQRATFYALNTVSNMVDSVFPEDALERMRDGIQAERRCYGLDKVRAELRAVETALLGFTPPTWPEFSARMRADNAAMATAAAKGKGE
jgi:hypothetical protein